ncbi:uncharacterized protein LOC107633001 [Arachis ipaensis]|uniref:uncharacterized protein LOC107633001 n=1 Tax=Arachis ipaensis TaxID=130454 RepID=UPI0007AF9E43|nr:uncharacterized protein LOC107633001 [Arachis ipaensis]XP_025638627.1 uncharacterized protein LOC112733760 [Arachis hypogaea]
MLTSRGIEANSEKCEAILNMASLKTIKEVQQLARRVAALSRFLPTVSNRSYHFFQTISKGKKFEWTKECETEFAKLKATLSSPPVLQSPEVGKLFQSRPALKSQILADFVFELTPDEQHYEKTWELQVDGASNREGSGDGIVLKEGETVMAELSLQFHFSASNNQAEYEALIAGIIPNNKTNPQNFRQKASLFTTVSGELYRRGFSYPLLKCLGKDKANEVMNEVHEGVCENHIGGQALATKIIRTGYYWPTMKRDSITKVKTCDNCQKHAAISMKPAEVMHSMEVSWPFYRWGLDILGPFPIALGEVKFLLVSIDYFLKWIEAQSLARITAEKVRSFIWKNIICRFGIPREIISDNGRQFTDNILASFLKNFNIQHHFSSVEHPQTTGQAEAANRIILQAMRKKLSDAKGEWADLIPEILWSYNTTIQTTTGETPFKLVYGTEALILVEVSIPTLRFEFYHHNHNIDTRKAELDLVEEDRDIAAIKQRAMKQQVEIRHNKRVVPRTFNEGDLVLREPRRQDDPHLTGNSPQIGKDHFGFQKCSEWGLTNSKHCKATHYQETGIYLH